MDPNALRNALTKLHQELGRAQQVDPESRKLLQELARDIERLAAKPKSATPATLSQPTHRHRLEELEVKFEADHPALAATLREFIDALAKAGL